MTNCKRKLRDLRSTADRVLDEDLAALSRMSERVRIEKYNEIKANEEKLIWEFKDQCPDIRTDQEFDRIRSQFRLARLLLAASFYTDGDVPPALADDFAEAALDAAVDFERYKQFDVLSEDQINRRIRRMEGEVYELVTEYTNSQLANMDELVDDPNVQQDLVDQLTDRYDQRLEKVRQGFYTYVEERGLQGMVTAIEDAIETVSEAQETQQAVERELAAELDDLSAQLERGFERQRQTVERRLQSVERELATTDPDVAAIRDRLDEFEAADVAEDYRETVADLEDAIEETSRLESRLESQIDELETAKRESSEVDESAVAEEVATIVDDELDELTAQRESIRAEVTRLERERESIEEARERLDERQRGLEERVEEIETSVDDGEGGIDGESLVTPTIARLLELDYVGRFETSMHEVPSIRLPEESFEVPDGYWDDRSERRNERPRLGTLLDESENPERYPVNRAARYEVTDSRYLGLSRSTEMVVEAAVFSDLEAHATNGFDAAPATLEDLLTYVNQSVYEAEDKELTYLLGIASPTGWTDGVRRQIAADGVSRTRFSRHVSVVLVDLQDGSLVYDESDPIARENSTLFELPVDDERVADCVADVESRLEGVGFGSDTVALGTLASEEGYDPHVVKRAFDRFTDRGGYAQQYVDDQLVLYEA